MTRLGLVGGAGVWHARSFAGLLNPKDEAGWAAKRFPGYATQPVDDAAVTAICDDNLEAARELAGLVEGIELVTDQPDQLLGRVDGVLICDDISEQHQKRAARFLEAGVPTFIDKPLSRDPAEAEAIFALAERHGAPVMSCSALRYATELAALDRAGLGDPLAVQAAGPGELVFYGVHVVELTQAILGSGVRAVRCVGDDRRCHLLLDYADGRAAMLAVREDIAYTFRATLLGSKGSAHLTVGDSAGFYRSMLVAIIEMIRTGVAPIAPADTLEILRVLDAAGRSRGSAGAEIRLAD